MASVRGSRPYEHRSILKDSLDLGESVNVERASGSFIVDFLLCLEVRLGDSLAGARAIFSCLRFKSGFHGAYAGKFKQCPQSRADISILSE